MVNRANACIAATNHDTTTPRAKYRPARQKDLQYEIGAIIRINPPRATDAARGRNLLKVDHYLNKD